MAGEKGKSVPVENGSKVNGGAAVAVPVMTFGSHGPEEDHFPKDVVDDWGAPTPNLSKDVVHDDWSASQKPKAVEEFHSLWFVKIRSYEDPKTMSKVDVARKELKTKEDARSLIITKLQGIRSQRHQISAKITPLSEENNKFKSILDDKKEKLEPLNQVMRSNNSSNRDRGENICSSLEELNRLIKSLEYRIQHESITLKEEKEVMREIKQLEGTREQVAAKDAHRAKIEESLGGKQAMQEQFNLIGDGVSGMKKERQVITAKIKKLIEERKEIDKDIEKIEKELDAATEKCTKAREAVWELHKTLDNSNASFFQNRTMLNKARTIADKYKDVAAIKELNKLENEKFMKAWKESKPFRDDYEKRILPHFDQKGLTRDGRQRNPDEKPMFAPEPSISSKPEPVVKPKQPKSEPVPAEKEPKSKPAKEVKEAEPVDVDGKEIIVEAEKPKKEEKKVDEAKLKEIRREEEIAKAKQALERKKKLAEKAAAKAAIKAQKEAEKKLKDREKKLKKKNPFSVEAEPEEQPAEEEAEVAEPEKTEEAAEKPVVAKSKGQKKSAMRNRSRGANGPDSISKVILKRKKATNYWVWAAPAAAAAVSLMVVCVIGYKFLV